MQEKTININNLLFFTIKSITKNKVYKCPADCFFITFCDVKRKACIDPSNPFLTAVEVILNVKNKSDKNTWTNSEGSWELIDNESYAYKADTLCERFQPPRLMAMGSWSLSPGTQADYIFIFPELEANRAISHLLCVSGEIIIKFKYEDINTKENKNNEILNPIIEDNKNIITPNNKTPNHPNISDDNDNNKKTETINTANMLTKPSTSDDTDEETNIEKGSGFVDCEKCEGTGAVTCEECGGEDKDGITDELCETCDGSGMMECEECDGTGQIECEECEGSGLIDCENCNGKGSVQLENEEDENESADCDTCSGTGKIPCPECSE